MKKQLYKTSEFSPQKPSEGIICKNDKETMGNFIGNL